MHYLAHNKQINTFKFIFSSEIVEKYLTIYPSNGIFAGRRYFGKRGGL